MKARPTRSRTRTRGAALVELAMILPIFVLLVFGVIEFGRGYHTRSALAHAAREAVREAALGIGDPATTARNAAPNLDGASMLVDIDPPGVCSDGEPVTVTLTYDHEYVIPLYGSGTWTLEEKGVMRCGG